MQMQLASSRDPNNDSTRSSSSSSSSSAVRDVDFDALLAHFQAVQDKHLNAKKEQKMGQLERLMQHQ